MFHILCRGKDGLHILERVLPQRLKRGHSDLQRRPGARESISPSSFSPPLGHVLFGHWKDKSVWRKPGLSPLLCEDKAVHLAPVFQLLCHLWWNRSSSTQHAPTVHTIWAKPVRQRAFFMEKGELNFGLRGSLSSCSFLFLLSVIFHGERSRFKRKVQSHLWVLIFFCYDLI